MAQLSKTDQPAPGDPVSIAVIGGGFTTYEVGTILSVEDGQVFLDNGIGNDPSGPFDLNGRRLENHLPGWTQRLLFDGGRRARAFEG